MRYRSLAIIFALLPLLIFTTACASGAPIVTTPSVTAAQDGATLVQERCTVCHSLDRITGAHYTAAEWKTVVDQMIAKGAQLTSVEESAVVQWLAATYGQ